MPTDRASPPHSLVGIVYQRGLEWLAIRTSALTNTWPTETCRSGISAMPQQPANPLRQVVMIDVNVPVPATGFIGTTNRSSHPAQCTIVVVVERHPVQFRKPWPSFGIV